MNFESIIAILFWHWIADFICQTDRVAQGKSKSWWILFEHACCYTIIFMYGLLITQKICGYFDYYIIGSTNTSNIFKQMYCLVFATHFVTDAITSRINAKLWKNKQIHWFFTSIGFDQLIHYVTLFYIALKFI